MKVKEHNLLGEEAANCDIGLIATKVVRQNNVPAHLSGYHFLRDAITFALVDREMMSSVTKMLYPAIAKKHSTTVPRVERAIRYAVKVAWEKGPLDVQTFYFGYCAQDGRKKPTNSEFIAAVADKLRLHLKMQI